MKNSTLHSARIRKPPKRSSACSTSFPVVGIGASAGGLETFTQLLSQLPGHTGMAYVLIQHLDPNHSSLLSVALAPATSMPVVEIKDGMKLAPNHVYVIPPANDLGILHGAFTLFPRDQTLRGPHMGVDFFFRALAADCGSQAIGVVLSGNATDGTEGLRAIKNENGLTLAQDPNTAKYSGMPQSAVSADVVDFCLPISGLVKELVRLAEHPYLTGLLTEPFSDAKDATDLHKVLVLLRSETGTDFSEYKSATIRRRLARRIALQNVAKLSDYVKFLQATPGEIKALATDLLIHVTSFFRDPEVFRMLKASTFSELVKNKAAGSSIRIWVAGCSSGEEVYSIAIALLEFLGERATRFQIQMFGSDLSERMIEKARTGIYPEPVMRDMDPERLRRFFVKVEGGYRINRTVRDLCVFVRHDLARDPPFSRLDLVTCRNVLIYFEQELQKRLISIFHYCLNQPGVLLLGRTESISGFSHLFSPVDKTNKIFSRVDVTSRLVFSVPQSGPLIREVVPYVTHPLTQDVSPPVVDIAKQVDHLLLTQYAPAGVVVNERFEVIQYRGKTSLYLEPPPGHPQLQILKLVREGLFSAVKSALDQAQKKMIVVRKEGLRFKQNKIAHLCNVVVVPIGRASESRPPLFLVLFEELPMPRTVKVTSKGKKVRKLTRAERAREVAEALRAETLQHELATTQDYLKSLNDEHQKTNDTLNSVNEELVSGNEELQSMNEELETAKEELQSTNEELTTVNDELQNRNRETSQANDDLVNLLNSVEIPMLILDLGLRIRRFTPMARTIMNLLATDIGRQIDDIKLNIVIPDLDQQIRAVIQSDLMNESEVQDRDGIWHRLQIRPYRSVDGKIAGAVLSLINVDLLRRAVIDAEWVRDYSTSIVEAVQIPLVVLDNELNFISANRTFYTTFGGSAQELMGRSIFEVGEGRWSDSELKSSLHHVIETKTSFHDLEVTSMKDVTDPRIVLLSGHPILSHQGVGMILLSVEDVTERKNREKDRRQLLMQAQEAKTDAEKANLTKDLFLATLSHELRTPLTSLLLQAQMLQRGSHDEAKVRRASTAIERAARTQTQLIEDLLDVSRIVTGKLKMALTTVDLKTVVREAIETVAAAAETKSILIEANLDSDVGSVSGDPVRLQQVVWNLLTNAIKFAPRGSSITINLQEVDSLAEIQVVDRGMGITPEFLPHVFSRFTQEETTNTRSHGGLGLGLAIVKHLVEMHQGSVKVESPGSNLGSTFTVRLPLLAEEGDKTDGQAKSGRLFRRVPKGQKSRLLGLRILLVEDDLGAREALTEMLTQAGAEVKAVASAPDAMLMLKEFEPDELVLDISMPEEDGYSLLRRIRKLGSRRSRMVPALALTALASEKDRADAFSAGFQMHLAKPVDMDRLTGALVDLNRNHDGRLIQ